MPYRHAHYWLLLLFPLTLLAFWPGYFSTLSEAKVALHIHGMTGTAWVLLLVAQSWTIHHRRNVLHRRIGLGGFLLFPLFTVGGLLVIQTMAQATSVGADPFYIIYGARLGTLDSISTVGIAWLFFMALKNRRKVHLHARYMIATVFFLFAPIFSRIFTDYPPFLIDSPATFHRFASALHLSNALAALLALGLAWRARKHARPFVMVATLIAFQSLAFDTIGRTAAWRTMFAAIGEMPTPTLIAIGLTGSAAILWFGWTSAPPARKPAAATSG
jgi:hypothetical protein